MTTTGDGGVLPVGCFHHSGVMSEEDFGLLGSSVNMWSRSLRVGGDDEEEACRQEP